MDVGTSKGLESFLAFLRETTERHRMAEADRAEAEAATQDLLHALELGDDKAPGRARLGLKIREVRRQRRTAKDIAEQTRPVVSRRKAGQFAGAVERLAGALAVNEIIRARRFLGAATSDEEREILLGMPLPELLRAAQALTSAVCLRQQTEAAEHMRELEAQQKAAQEPRKGPFVS